MVALGQAGFNTNEILKAMPATLDLAAAGGIELGEAADIVSNVLAGFGEGADQTTRFVDVMAKSANSANVTIGSMGESFKEIASTAKVLGVEVEEVGSFIDALGNAGIKGTNATNAVQSSLLRLAAPTQAAADKMKELNVEFFDGNGEFIGLTETIATLEDKFVDLTKEQQLSAVSAIFGKNAANQWLTTMSATKDVIVSDLAPATKELLGLTDEMSTVTLEGSDVLRLYESELQNADGAARKMADTMTDNLDGALKRLNSAWEGLILNIASGESSMGSFAKNAVDFLAELVRESEQIFDTYFDLFRIFGDIFEIITEVVGLFGDFGGEVNAASVIVDILSATLWLATLPLRAILLLVREGVKEFKRFIERMEGLARWVGILEDELSESEEQTRKQSASFGILDEVVANVNKRLKEHTEDTDENTDSKEKNKEATKELTKEEEKQLEELKKQKEQFDKNRQASLKYFNGLKEQSKLVKALIKLDEDFEAGLITAGEAARFNVLIHEKYNENLKEGSIITKDYNATVGETADNLKAQAVNLGGFNFSVLDFFKSDDADVVKIRESLGSIAGEFTNFLETTLRAREQQQEANLDLTNERLDGLRSELEEEEDILKERREKGLALDTQKLDDLKSSIENEEKLREQQEAALEKTRKRQILFQLAIDQASAISSLIVAAEANPLNATTFSAAGVAQFAAGIIRILANFAVAKTSLDQFADGGEIGGKPHSQGGTVIEAEKDEFIIKKSSYKNSKLMANAINDGLISDKDFKSGQNLLYLQNSMSTSKMEGLIQEQNSISKEHYNYVQNGETVEHKGNVTIVRRGKMKTVYI